MKKYFFLILPLLFLLAACGSGLSAAAVSSFELTLTATITPMPTATKVTVINYAETMAANEIIAGLTRQAGEMEAERLKQAAEQAKLDAEKARLNATARADALNATASADVRTARAQDNMLTAHVSDAQTARAEATHGQETAVAAVSTKQFQPTADMWTATAVQQDIDIKQGTVTDVSLAVQRQIWKNLFDALLPWALTVCLFYVSARGFQTYMKNRAHERDKHGRSPTLQRELSDGSTLYVKPDQMETAIMKVTRDGEVVRYEPIDKDEQSKINRANSITDIVGQLPIQYAQAGKDLLNKFASAESTPPNIKIVNDAKSLLPVLEEAEGKLVEE